MGFRIMFNGVSNSINNTMQTLLSSVAVSELTIHTDFSASWVGIYEIWILDKHGTEHFQGLTGLTETQAMSMAEVSPGEFATDSDYGADNTRSNMNNSLPSSYDVTNSSGGSPEWKITNPNGMKTFIKFNTPIQLVGGGKIYIAYRNNYGDCVSVTHFYDQNDLEITPTVAPADMNDGLVSTATTQMTIYEWQF